ncbi:methionyl-tRNA formyltransferase [Lentisphaera profundi]|uniref:Methionyl-tRNA formyltransferase n=1 Tax=Lentisphaera profundi TaxID=1658616 RepID=A0ABY7VVP1_9BACT|nr:methionyl-tRNA formyltransferase [Lentisphaera profundi]WDE96133.1 methionyl-tRNA formyltransferase [Lentisphaera profundi]
MKQAPIKVFFIGSGAIGIPAVMALQESVEIDLLGVASQPDRPAGRKRRLTPSPLATWAESEGFSVHKPEKVSSQEFVDYVGSLKPDIVVVIAYGQLLRENLLHLAPFSCLNVHASILPFYRGASPIFSAVLGGEKESGVAIMKMAKGMDTGAVYRTHKVVLEDQETTGSLELKLADVAGKQLVKDIQDVVHNGLEAIEQNHDLATSCSKIDKSFGLLDWSKSAKSNLRKIFACQPWPGTWTYYQVGDKLKRLAICKASLVNSSSSKLTPGEIVVEDSCLQVACGSLDFLEVHRVKPEGKREMDIKDFLLGAGLTNGDCLTSVNH